MPQILQYFSTRIADLGNSIYRKTHGVFAFIPFSQSPQFEFTPTSAVPASPILDTTAKFLEPSQLWTLQQSTELPYTQGFDSEPHRGPFTIIDSGLLWATKPLILLLLLVLLCLPFSSDLRSLISTLLSFAKSFSSKFSALVHAHCCEEIGRADAELAKKSNALDLALQQIERGNSRVESLVAENGSLSSLILDQEADIRMQSAVVTRLEGQLDDQERVILQAARLREQQKREAHVNRKEVARLKSQIASLTTESDRVQSMLTSNLHSAEIREEQLRDSLDTATTQEERLRDTLRSNEMLLSQVQAALCTAEDTGRAQLQALTLELETCAMQRERWKTTAEQAELRVVAADRSMLDLRKELAVALRNVREAKEQLESQTVVIEERDATIRSLNRELAEVQGQLQDTKDGRGSLQPDFERIDAWKPWDVKDEVDNLQPDFEHIEAWKPLHSQLDDGPPPVLEWREWLTKDEPKVPILATQERSRPPHISLVELCSDGPTPIHAAATLPDGPLSCSTTPVIRSSPFDDPFVVDSLLKPRPTNPTFAVLNLAGSPATPVSPLGGTEMIEDLQEQVALEQVARVDAEYQLTLQQLKVLATEAVIVVQRRQLTDHQCRLSEETAKNASLREEIRNLKVDHSVIAARISQSEASLAECQTARIAANKASDDSRTELAKVKEMLPILIKEADELRKEVDNLLNLKVERGAMVARVAHLETSLAESLAARKAATKVADDTHTELVKVKETWSVVKNEANGLRKEARELKKETDGLKKERYDLDLRLSQAMLLSSALQERVEELEQKAANVRSSPSDERKEARELKKKRHDLDTSQAILFSSALHEQVEDLKHKEADAPSTPSDERKEDYELTKERYDLNTRLSQAMPLSSALHEQVQDLKQKAANVRSSLSDERKEGRELKKERYDLDTPLSLATPLSFVLHEQVQDLKQKAANVRSSPSDERKEDHELKKGRYDLDMRLEMPLLSAQEQVKDLEQKAANFRRSPSDERKEDRKLKKERYDLDTPLSLATPLSSALHEQVQCLKQKEASVRSSPPDERKEDRELKKERYDLDRLSLAMSLSSALHEQVQDLKQKAANVCSSPSDKRKEDRELKKERYDLDMRLSQVIPLSSALQEQVKNLEQKAANVRSSPSDERKEDRKLKKERYDLDMRLSQVMPLSSALQEQLKNLEQKANVRSSPSDETDSGSDRSVNLVVSESVSYILDAPLPSLSSWGSIPDPSLLYSRPFPLVKTNFGTQSLLQAAPSRKNWPTFHTKLPATPPTASHEFGGLVTSETALSLMLAATPPEPLPILSPVSPSTSSSPLSDPSSSCHLTSYPRPEDCPMPILGRVRKTLRKSSPPHISQPYPHKGKPTRR